MSTRGASGKQGVTDSRSGGSSSSATSESLQTPWTRARKLKYEQQEQRLNSLPGGQKGVNSGRFHRFPRDGRIYDFLVETRTNQKPGAKSATISKDEFLQLRRQALEQPGGMKPGMQITIDELDLFVMDLADFTSMYERLIELAERDRDDRAGN